MAGLAGDMGQETPGMGMVSQEGFQPRPILEALDQLIKEMHSLVLLNHTLEERLLPILKDSPETLNGQEALKEPGTKRKRVLDQLAELAELIELQKQAIKGTMNRLEI